MKGITYKLLLLLLLVVVRTCSSETACNYRNIPFSLLTFMLSPRLKRRHMFYYPVSFPSSSTVHRLLKGCSDPHAHQCVRSFVRRRSLARACLLYPSTFDAYENGFNNKSALCPPLQLALTDETPTRSLPSSNDTCDRKQPSQKRMVLGNIPGMWPGQANSLS